MRLYALRHAAFILALTAGTILLAPAAWSQDSAPSPTASPPTEADAASADGITVADPAVDGPAKPIDDIPLPEERPSPSAEDTAPAPADTPKPTAAPSVPAIEKPPVPTPDPAKPDAPAPAAKEGSEAPPAAAPAGDGAAAPTPTVPQSAYVPPEKARTSPEPGAPETPPMDVTPAQTVEAAAAVEDAVLCEAELKERGAEFSVGTTIAEGDCGVLRPVKLTKLSSGVSISPDTQFLCRTALALDIWMTDGVLPAAKSELDGAKITALAQASTYVCRARASESRISEHSRGSAIDVGGFTLSGGKTLTIGAPAPASPEDRFEAAIRRAACGPFKTVLGPGTDSDHGTHLHLDIAARSNGSTYCR